MTSLTKPIATDDYDAAHQAAQAYVDGYRTGDLAGIERGFHENSIMWGHVGDDLLKGAAIPAFGSFFEAYGASPDLRSRIDVLAIAPTAAVVRVDLEANITGTSFTDYLSLLKIDGQWKIIAKVFQAYA